MSTQVEEQSGNAANAPLAQNDYEHSWAEDSRQDEAAPMANEAETASEAPADAAPASETEESGPEPDSAQSEDDAAKPEYWEHKFKSEAGRRRKAEEDLAELRRRLEALEQRKAPAPEAAPAQTQAPAAGAKDFAARGEAYAEFAATYPELVSLLSENGRVGDLLRRRLEDYGADEAALLAIPIHEGRKSQVMADARLQAQNEEAALARRDQFISEVYAQHPDVIERINKGEGAAMFEELEAYAKGHPYEEAAQMLAILEGNDARALNALIGRFKKDRQATPNSTQRQAIAGAMSAVPARGASRPRQGGSADNSYDRAWDEAD